MGNLHEEAVRHRAYQIWETEGQPQGQEAEHWRRAEEELAANPTNFNMGTAMEDGEGVDPFEETELGEMAPDGAPASKRERPAAN